MPTKNTFSFNSKNFLVETALLNLEQIGLYSKLLALMHQHGPIPSNSERLASLLNIPRDKFMELYTKEFANLFIKENSTLFHQSLKPKSKPKPKQKKEFIPPTIQEVIQFFKENGFPASLAKEAYNYYKEGNWKDSRDNPVLNWKQKMRVNWFREDRKENNTTVIDMSEYDGRKQG